MTERVLYLLLVVGVLVFICWVCWAFWAIGKIDDAPAPEEGEAILRRNPPDEGVTHGSD